MFNRGGRIILILFFVVTGFFCCLKNYLSAEEDTVVINEIAWMGTENSPNDEWIELYNQSDAVVSLNGWKIEVQDGSPQIALAGEIKARSYYLLERTDDNSVAGIVADLIYSGVLGNEGEYMELKNGAGETIDSVNASAGWQTGDNATKQTMSYFGSQTWKKSLLPGGTPRAMNNFESGAVEEPDCSDESCTATASGTAPVVTDKTGNTSKAGTTVKFGEVLINELVSDPADEDVEWVELYNKTSRDISLNDWSLEDGGNARTLIKGTIGHVGQNRFFVIEKPKGSLNNSGDMISLRSSSGVLLDTVAYGSWDDGNVTNNAPSAKDPFSLARTKEGINSGIAANDFSLTSTPTKGGYNQISSTEKTDQDKTVSFQYSEGIEISEVFPNPIGVDDETEFIELYNNTKSDLNICAWELGDGSKSRYKIRQTEKFDCVIRSGVYAAFLRSETKLALNNGGDAVSLFFPAGTEAIKAVAYEKAIEGSSYAIRPSSLEQKEKEYVWTSISSPGQENSLSEDNKAEIDFSFPDINLIGLPVFFDSSDIEPANGELIFFHWNFGDGFFNTLACPQHTFFKAGEYTVKLSVGNAQGTSTKEKILRIQGSVGDESVGTGTLAVLGRNDLVISEVLPNPIGLDGDGEFVEIYNSGTTKINLINWSIDDDYEGSNEYKFLDDIWLDAGEYYSLDRNKSKLAFNNDHDAIRLFDGSLALVDEVEYDDPGEGYAYARGENSKWFWTSESTPSKENIIKVSGVAGYEASALTGSASKLIRISSEGEKNLEYVPIFLGNLDDVEIGSKISATGTVIAVPGVLGAQIFYIFDTAGVQIYSYKKDFPLLAEGDLVRVDGELSVSGGEYRLKTKSRDDIRVLGQTEVLPARKAKCDDLDDDAVGDLVEISGLVTERKGASIIIDDGTDEFMVYIKTSTAIDAAVFEEGEEMSVRGVISKTKTGLRLLPRSNKDIVKISLPDEDGGAVLGEVSVNDEWELEKRNKQAEFYKYFSIIVLGALVLSVWFVVKK